MNRAFRIELAAPSWLADAVDPDATHRTDAEQILLAIALARRNVEERSGGPFGALVFDAAGRVVAAGVNAVVPNACSLAHAEILALASAQQALGRPRLNGDGGRYTLATSAQPCCQCYGALLWAGIDRLLIGARAEDVMQVAGFDEGPLPADWIGELARRGMEVRRDLQRDAACAVLEAYARGGGPLY